MFGNKEMKIGKMVLKGKWEKINDKYINANAETRLLLAQKCAEAKDPGVSNVLSVLLRDTDEKVQLAAIQATGATGTDRDAAELQWLLSNISEDKTEIIAALHDALSKVTGKK